MGGIIVEVGMGYDLDKKVSEIETTGTRVVAKIDRFRTILCKGEIETLNNIEGITARLVEKYKAMKQEN